MTWASGSLFLRCSQYPVFARLKLEIEIQSLSPTQAQGPNLPPAASRGAQQQEPRIRSSAKNPAYTLQQGCGHIK